MMGPSHAISGAAAWLALTADTAVTAGVLEGVDTASIWVGAGVATGAAMLPDLDHQHAKAANFLPPVTNVISNIIGTVSGGHRHGTHSFIGAGVFTVLAAVAAGATIDHADWSPTGTFQIGAAIMALLLAGLGLRTLKLTPNPTVAWIAAFASAWAVGIWAPEQTWWLPLAVGVGSLAHIAGDMLTVQGVPLLWPLNPKPAVETPLWRKNGYFSVPLLGSTGSVREWVFATLLTGYVLLVAAIHTGVVVI